MNILEKILEEIKEATFQEDAPIYIGDMEVDGYVRASRIEEIIRFHMDDGKGINVSDKDGWVSAKERMLIYGCRGCWEPEEIEEMRLLEQALGIRLFAWQKAYIKNGNFRCFGKTTAVIIRILTQGKEPVDLRNREKIQKYVMMDTPWIATGPVCGVFKREVKEIHEKLLAAGVKTNPVFYTEMDRKKFLRKEEKDE